MAVIFDVVVKKDGTGDYTTLADAIAAAPTNTSEPLPPTGDVCHITVGDSETYTEFLNVNKNNIMIFGGEGYRPVLAPPVLYSSNGAFRDGFVLSNFRVEGATGTSFSGIAGPRFAYFYNVEINDCGRGIEFAKGGDAGFPEAFPGASINRCRIRVGTHQDGVSQKGFGVNITTGTEVYNSLIILDGVSDGIKSSSTYVGKVYHNTVVGTSKGRNGITVDTGTEVKNNIVVGTTTAYTGGTRSHNHAWAAATPFSTPTAQTGELEKNPLLKAGTYSLRPVSTCIASGTALGITNDYLGVARNMTAPCRGCFEDVSLYRVKLTLDPTGTPASVFLSAPLHTPPVQRSYNQLTQLCRGVQGSMRSLSVNSVPVRRGELVLRLSGEEVAEFHDSIAPDLVDGTTLRVYPTNGADYFDAVLDAEMWPERYDPLTPGMQDWYLLTIPVAFDAEEDF